MGESECRVIEDPMWGYRRLDPIPSDSDLSRYYQSRYCDLIRRGTRAPELRRLMEGGRDAKEESRWLASTLYADILWVLEAKVETSGPTRILDVGCGTGEFISFMRRSGWEAVGLEPTHEFAAVAREKGLEVNPTTVEEYLATWPLKGSEPFTAVSMLNVLEHVPEPIEFLGQLRQLLVPGGILVIRVPNDFNELQLSAQQALGKDPWWIVVPDHVNYFSYSSLSSILKRLGFEVIYVQGDYPMEIFLLMGEDYVGNSELGRKCHQKRVNFELSIPPGARRAWYRALAKADFGRNCLLFGRVR